MGKKKVLNDNKPRIRIQNVVASASLKHGIDIKSVCEAFPETEYRPEIFPGLVFRLNKPKTATLIFSSGKMVCTGAKSAKGSIRALKRIFRMLKKENITIIGKPEIEIHNIVASANLAGKVDLFGFYQKCRREMGGSMMYEPEQFPSIIYRMEEPKAVILVFASGKLVCTGARDEADVYHAIEKLRKKLDQYDAITYNKMERFPVLEKGTAQ